MTIPRDQIKSKWTSKTGQWIGKNQYVVRRKVIYHRELILGVCAHDSGHILRFYNGPTGCVDFYIRSLLRFGMKRKDDDPFFICAGAINSWPMCEVRWGDVYAYLRSQGYDQGYNDSNRGLLEKMFSWILKVRGSLL